MNVLYVAVTVNPTLRCRHFFCFYINYYNKRFRNRFVTHIMCIAPYTTTNNNNTKTFQGTCRRRKEPVLGPDTQPLRTCHPAARRSTRILITGMAREPDPSLPLSTKRPGKQISPQNIVYGYIFVFARQPLIRARGCNERSVVKKNIHYYGSGRFTPKIT